MNINENDSFEDVEDENISDFIKNSAINKKNPGLFSDNKNFDLKKENNKQVSFLSNIIDCYYGNKEFIRLKFNKGSSERAIKETMEYYKSLYISKIPNLKELSRLLKRNKQIDFPNQFVFGEENFFEFHESGTLSIELNVILSHVINKQDSFFTEEEKNEIKKVREKDWMSVEEIYESNLLEEEENDKLKYDLAIKSWAMIVSSIYNLDHLKSNIHQDNIELASVEVLLNFKDNDYVSKKDYINGVRRLNLIEENMLNSILNKKQIKKENYEKRQEEKKSVLNKSYDIDKEILDKIPTLNNIKNKIKKK